MTDREINLLADAIASGDNGGNGGGMSTQAPKPRLTKDQIADMLQQSCDDHVAAFLHERRVALPRLERYAVEALARPEERFESEKRIARVVLDRDIPERERELDATLLLLQTAPYKLRAEYLLADFLRREAMVKSILIAGGLDDDHGNWRSL